MPSHDHEYYQRPQVSITAASSLLSGYDQGVIATAMLTMRPDLALSGVQVETSIGCLNLAAAAGGILASYLADSLGRKKTIGVAYAYFFVGSIAIAAAPGFWLVLLGRLIQGVGVGIVLVVPAVLQAELVPAHRRGGLVSVGDVCCNLGILLGYSSGLVFFGLDQQWRCVAGRALAACALEGAGEAARPRATRAAPASHGRLLASGTTHRAATASRGVRPTSTAQVHVPAGRATIHPAALPHLVGPRVAALAYARRRGGAPRARALPAQMRAASPFFKRA